MINIIYSKDSKKSLDSYEKKISLRIIKAVEDIPQSDIKRLEGNNVPILFRLRVGKYRIIYYYSEKDCIKIIKIDTRGDIYK